MRRSSLAAVLAVVLIAAGVSFGQPAMAQTSAAPAAEATLSENVVRALQEALNEQGIAVPVDGVLDDPTFAAIRQYQSQHHLPVTGAPDAATLEKLGVTASPSAAQAASSSSAVAAAPSGGGGMPDQKSMRDRMSTSQGMMDPSMMGMHQGMMGGQAQMPGMMGMHPGMMSMMGGHGQMPGMAGRSPRMGGDVGGFLMCPMMGTMAGMHHGMMGGQAQMPGMMGMHPGMMPMAPGAMGMMGQGMAPGMTAPSMHHGMMMGKGRGPGSEARGFGRVRPILHLSIDDVRHHFEQRLEWRGNPRLSLGEVSEVDEDTIVVEIETVDGALVDRLSVDRHTGSIRRID